MVEVIITITDDGPGMSPNQAPRRISSNSSPGYGLGLSIVKDICKAIGGTFSILPVMVGTSIQIKFNAKSSGIITPKLDIRVSCPTPRERSETILIVDDLEMNRKLLSNILVKHFKYQTHNILYASNDREGLDIFNNNSNINLIFLDKQMPVMDGVEMYRELRGTSKGKYIPVIFVTGSTMFSDITHDNRSAIIYKPITINAIKTVLLKLDPN